MLKDNGTPFAALAFEQLHRDRRRMAVVCVRASYSLQPDGGLVLGRRQALVLADEYDGPPATSPLVRAGDLVPFKPGADVTVLADAHAPNGEPATSWTAGVRVDDHASILRVHGRRTWEPQRGARPPAWRLSEAEPATSVPIDYRRASGGRIIGHPQGAADRRNPVGAGLIDPAVTSPGLAYDAATIDAEEAQVRAVGDRPEPAGFGPMGPSYQSRQRHLGTLDMEQIARTGSRLPDDHDYRYWQCAHPGLRLGGHLPAGATVALGRLVEGGGTLRFRIPAAEPVVVYSVPGGGDVAAAANRDGLHVDLRGAPPWPVDITFRCWMEMRSSSLLVSLALAGSRQTAGLPAATADGLAKRGA